jgi:probable rRNA maturation factor
MNGAKCFFFHTHLISYRINHRTEIRRVLSRLFSGEKKVAKQIDFILCSDEYLLELNQSHLQHDYLTDVITFDYTEPKSDEGIVAEIYISVDRVRENASDFNVRLNQELHRVMMHGALHLCGYKDNTSNAKLRMTAKEDYYLSLF